MSRLLRLAAIASAVLCLGTAPPRRQAAPRPPACPGPVRVVGAFSNIRATADHAYGYEVELWRCGDTIVGLFSFTEGRPTDFDTGTVDDAAFDPRTGKLVFNAYVGQYEFSGVLRKDALSGQLTRHAPAGLPSNDTKEDIVLRRSANRTILLSEYPTYDEWKAGQARILKRLGPRR